MNEYAILSIHGVLILFGVLLMTPMGSSLAAMFHSRYPSTTTRRGQILAGMMFVCLGGFTVSAQTLWMHNKLSEGASVCSGDTILNCDGLIGNAAYNTDPLLDQPWGLIGMVAFTLLMWFVITIAKEPMSSETPLFIKGGLVLRLLDFQSLHFLSVMRSRKGSSVLSAQLLTSPTSSP